MGPTSVSPRESCCKSRIRSADQVIIFEETADSQFEWRDFIAQNNNELLAKLGNFVNRIVKLVNSKIYNSVIPDYTAKYSDPVFEQAKADINQHLKRYLKDLEAVNLKDGLQSAMDIAQAGNNFVSGVLQTNDSRPF